MRVTSKGQVTIPQDVRRRLGITAGSEVDFAVTDVGVQLVRRSSDDGAAVVAAMRGRATGVLSTEQIMTLTREDT